MTTAIQTSVAQELQSIADANGGVLKPEQVVEFAKDPDTALHNQFTWDDTRAAREYRLHQARNIIRVSVVVVGSKTQNVRAFVSLKSDRIKPGGGYRQISVVMSDDAMRGELLRDALADFKAIKEKHEKLQELRAVFDAIDEADEKFSQNTEQPKPEQLSPFGALLSSVVADRSTQVTATKHKGTRY